MVIAEGSKLLMVIGLFHPIVGGAEKVCQTLSKRFMDKGIAVTILTQYRDGLPEHEVIDGVPVYRKMKGWHPFGLVYMFSVLSFLIKNRGRFDIIQCFGLFLFIPPAVLMKYFCDKKVLLRLLCSGDCGDFAGIEQLTFKRLIVAAAKRCDRIIYLSDDIKHELLEHHFPPDKLAYIPNGVDVERFTPLKRSEHYGSKNICFVGRIEAQKGLEFLMRAMAVITSRDSEVTLTLVGEGQQRAALEDLARSLSLAHHVVFTGFVENVLPYYHSARVFVLPSLSEGMSSSLLEAMSCGLPVVTTLVGGSREIVAAPLVVEKQAPAPYHIGERGIVIYPEDVDGMAEALLKLLHDDGLSGRLGERAQEYIRSRFSQEQVVGEYIHLYHQLI
jgi:glycosyltransferase involved in cell wall biosynthesis